MRIPQVLYVVLLALERQRKGVRTCETVDSYPQWFFDMSYTKKSVPYLFKYFMSFSKFIHYHSTLKEVLGISCIC